MGLVRRNPQLEALQSIAQQIQQGGLALTVSNIMNPLQISDKSF